MKQFRLIRFLLVLTVFAPNIEAAEQTKDPYIALGEELADYLNAGDLDGFSAIVDVRSFAYRICESLRVTKEQISKCAKATIGSSSDKQFVNTVFKNILGLEAASYKFIRVIDSNKPTIRAEFKNDDGYAYFIFHTRPARSKGIQVVDVFTLSNGRLFSEHLGKFSQIYSNSDPTFFERLFGALSQEQSVTDQLKDMQRHVIHGDFAKAYSTIMQLPPEIRDSRVMVDTALTLSQSLEEADYDKQLTRLHTLFGNDPSTAFMLIDYQFMVGDYDAGVKLVDQTASVIGNDGVLETLRSFLYYMKEDYNKGISHARAAVSLESDLEWARDILISNLIGNRDFAAAIAEYKELETLYGYDYDETSFTEDADYADFIKSPSYKQWMSIE